MLAFDLAFLAKQIYLAFMLANDRLAAQMGFRLKAARERRGLTQQQMAAALGLEHRQTLASIENGERKVTAIELVNLVRVLQLDLDYFTDAFRLDGEGRFSFRADPSAPGGVLDDFEAKAGRWIATYRELATEHGVRPTWLQYKLGLTPKSTYEQAQAAAESLSSQWKLGERPAEALAPALERHLDALVLHVDAPEGVSGAASQLPGLNSVLVNRREPEGRRHFDLAHEFFHLLTWDAMPPARVEAVSHAHFGKLNRVEQLAENFAAALLMPERIIRARWTSPENTDEVAHWSTAFARDLRVSVAASTWRLHNLNLISKAEAQRIIERRGEAADRTRVEATPPRLFSERFVRCIGSALDAGRLSVMRAADLLDLSLAELAELLRSYQIEPSFEA